MSYTIYSPSNCSVVLFTEHPDNPIFKILDPIIENDVKEGLYIPYFLRSSSFDREIMVYPPDQQDVRVFAILYKKIIFDAELVKHGYTIR